MASLNKTNISIMGVHNILGDPSYDMGTLCKSSKINMWAKYKPVKHNFTFNRPTDWWRGIYGNCGITFNRYTNVGELINSINANNYTYKHDYPTGGSSSPYRLGDFAGYNHSATPPVIASNVEGTYYKNNTSFGCSFIVKMGGDDTLSAEDVYNHDLNGVYPAIAFVRSGSTAYQWITSSSAGATNMITIPLNSFLTNSTYFAYQFLSSVKKDSFTMTDMAGDFFIVPETKKQTIKIESTNVNVTLINVQRSSNGTVTGTMKIKNGTGSMLTYSSSSVLIKYGNGSAVSAMESGEYNVNLGSFTVAAGVTKDVQFSQPNTLPDFNLRGGKVIGFLNKIQMVQTMIPMMAS